jgi:hypothetical protein
MKIDTILRCGAKRVNAFKQSRCLLDYLDLLTKESYEEASKLPASVWDIAAKQGRSMLRPYGEWIRCCRKPGVGLC